jgi:hypothetical protein
MPCQHHQHEGPKVAGATELHWCADGTPFACPGGAEGCFDSSPAHCEGPARGPGGAETHRCADGRSFSCAGGTEGCFDGSPRFCGPGGAETHSCAGGTEGCSDGSPRFCGGARQLPPALPPAPCQEGSLGLCVQGSYVALPKTRD